MTDSPDREFKMGSVEVTLLDEPTLSIGITIQIKCAPDELSSPKIHKTINTLAKKKLQYLFDEGFIKSDHGWKIAMTVVGQPPNDYV